MKHKKIFFSGLIVIVAAAAIMTIAQTSYAANLNSANKTVSTSQLSKHMKLGLGVKKGISDTDSATLDARKTDMLKKQAAVTAALDANDYNAWVQAVGTSSPMLTKINSSNFSKFDQAYQLRKQADAIMTELGLNQGMKYGLLGTKNK